MVAEEKYSRSVMLQAANLYSSNKLSLRGCESFLKNQIKNLKILGDDRSLNVDGIIKKIPQSLETVFRRLKLYPTLVTRTCCAKCFALYEFDLDDHPSIKTCTQVFMSSSKKYVKQLPEKEKSPQCNEDLYTKSYKEKKNHLQAKKNISI